MITGTAVKSGTAVPTTIEELDPRKEMLKTSATLRAQTATRAWLSQSGHIVRFHELEVLNYFHQPSMSAQTDERGEWTPGLVWVDIATTVGELEVTATYMEADPIHHYSPRLYVHLSVANEYDNDPYGRALSVCSLRPEENIVSTGHHVVHCLAQPRVLTA